MLYHENLFENILSKNTSIWFNNWCLKSQCVLCVLQTEDFTIIYFPASQPWRGDYLLRTPDITPAHKLQTPPPSSPTRLLLIV